MKFLLISRHTNGAQVPADEQESNLAAMDEWLKLILPTVAMPARAGVSLTANTTTSYQGDVGGIIVFEAESMDHALALAAKSPGLNYGFTHDVFAEISLSDASKS